MSAANSTAMSTADRVTTHLEARGFKKHGSEWRGNSPFRADSDSGAFSLTVDGPENGAWFDHARNEGGSLYDLAEKLGIERPAGPIPVENTKRAYANLDDYARAHGAPAAAFTAARWRETTCDNRPALAFDTTNGTRYRFLDGNKPPYKSPAGYESCWYGLTRAANKAVETGLPLVLVNGEASVVVCQHHNIPAAAVTSGGERALSPALIDELRKAYSGKVIIAFDCDEAGRRASALVAGQLTGYDVAQVDLGFGDHGDAADWCKLHGENAGARLMERAKFTAVTPPKQSRIGVGLLVDQIKDRARLIKTGQARQYLPTGYRHWDRHLDGGMYTGVNIIAGSSGMGKTTLMASLASMWTGAGHRGLIVTTEMHPMDWIPRIIAHMARVKASDVVRGNISPSAEDIVADSYDLLAKAGHQVILETTPTVNTVAAHVLDLVTAEQVDFVMIDSMSNMRASGVSASIYDQTKAVSNALVELQREAQNMIGVKRPLPFVVSVQTNTATVARRSNKVATQLDAYGGQTVGQDATTYTTLNYHQYFVDKQLAEPDDRFPPGVAALVVDKARYGGGSAGEMIRLRFAGGMGFYDDNVPEPRPPSKHNGHQAPRQYKDDTFDEPVKVDMPFGDTEF